MSEGLKKIKELLNSPFSSGLKNVDKYRDYFNMLENINPSLFKDTDFTIGEGIGVGSPEAIEVFKNTPGYKASSKIESTKNKGVQAKLLGLIDSEQFQTLTEKGIAPKLTGDQNVWGRLGAIGSFPLQKILSGLNVEARGMAGMMTANIEATKKLIEQKKAGAGAEELIKSMFQAAPEVASETFKSAFNTPGAKSNEYFAEVYKKYLPEKFSKGYEWTEDQNDWVKGTNWIQKLGSAIAGSPADIAGLVTDVLISPSTYLTGGLAKGAKVADIAVDIISKTGKKVIPKGATVVFTKVGKEALEEVTPAILKTVERNFAKEIATFTSKAQLDNFLEKKVSEQFLSKVGKKMTAGQILNLVDTGGAKIAGQTIIPGFKLQQTFGRSLDEVAKLPIFKNVVKFFNPQAGIDEIFRPLKAYGESLARSVYGKNLGKFTRIIKNLSKEELKDLNLLKIIDSNVPLLEKRFARANRFLRVATRETEGKVFADPIRMVKGQVSLDDVTRKIAELEKLRNGIKITPKVKKAAEELGDLLGEVRVEEVGLGYKQAEDYFPAIFQKETNPSKWNETSIEKAFFEKSKTKDIITSLEEGLKIAPIEESIPYRLRAGAKRLARVELTDGVKQFGIKGKMKAPKGHIELKGADGRVMKELKGWYFPKELENSFTKVGQLFFGDEAARNAVKYYDKALTIWKRWALATPGYHFRNFYSDTFSGVMEYGFDFLNPKHWADFIKLKKTGSLKIGNKVYTVDDFLKAGIEPGQYIAEGRLTQGLSQDLIGKISPAEWSLKFGQHREGLGRGVAGIIELKKGSSIIDAAFNVKKVFFDYMNLTSAEQNIMKRIFPFYTWMRKNLQRQVELLATRTGGYASIPKFLNYLEETAQTMYGDEFFDQFKATQPDYMKDLGATLTAIKGEDGNPLVWNPNLPFQDWSRLTPKDLISASSPLIQIITELTTNRDIFFGSTIDRAREGRNNYSKAPAWLNTIVQKFPDSVLKQIGMKSKNEEIWISDRAAYTLRQIPPLASLSRVLPATETPKTGLDIMSVGLGAKFFPYNLEKEKAGRGQEFIDAVNSLKEPEDPDLDDIERALKALYERQISEETGMDDIRSWEDMFKVTGGRTEEMSVILQLLKQPYYEKAEKVSGQTLAELMEFLESEGYDFTEEDIREAIEQ